MSRALAVAGVLGAGTALVFWAAFLAFSFLPSDRLVWQSPASVDVELRLERGPVVMPAPVDPDFQPWQGPSVRGPLLVEPPVIIEPPVPRATDPVIEG